MGIPSKVANERMFFSRTHTCQFPAIITWMALLSLATLLVRLLLFKSLYVYLYSGYKNKHIFHSLILFQSKQEYAILELS